MTITTRTVVNSLDVGMVRQLAQITDTSGAGGVYEIEVNSRADRLALFLSTISITGTMNIEVFTKENLQSNISEMPVVSFPVQTTPTSSYLRIVTPIIISPFVIRITYSGSVTMSLYGKAVNSVEAEGILEVAIGGKDTYSLLSQHLTIPNTWYTIALPSGTRDLEIQADPPARLDIRFSSSDDPEYWPVPAGNTYVEQFLATSALTSVQVRCPGSSPVVRVKVWKSN
jgi:hypothetical protein